MNVLDLVADLLTPALEEAAQASSNRGDRGDKGDNASVSRSCASLQGGDTGATRGDIATKDGSMSPCVAPLSHPTTKAQALVSRGMSPLSPLSPSPDSPSSEMNRESCTNAPMGGCGASTLTPPEKRALTGGRFATGGVTEPLDPWAQSDERATRSARDQTGPSASEPPATASPSGEQAAGRRRASDSEHLSDRDDTRYRLWDVIKPDGQCQSVSLTPPATRAEMQEAHPQWWIMPVIEPSETDSGGR